MMMMMKQSKNECLCVSLLTRVAYIITLHDIHVIYKICCVKKLLGKVR